MVLPLVDLEKRAESLRNIPKKYRRYGGAECMKVPIQLLQPEYSTAVTAIRDRPPLTQLVAEACLD